MRIFLRLFVFPAASFLSLSPSLSAAQEFGLYVDANLDGIVAAPGGDDSRAPIDHTTAAQPFLFWTNYDQDDRAYFETLPVKKPDLLDEVPNSLRDLEDFARLHITLGEKSFDTLPEGSLLTLRWNNTTMEPGIRIFPAHDPSGYNRYVTDPAFGRDQLDPPFGQAIGSVTAAGPLSIPVSAIPRNDQPADRIFLLFEGTSIGSGELTAELKLPDGSVTTSEPAYLDIRHVKQMYDRVRVPWPFNTPPYANLSKGPPEPVLHWENDPIDYPFQKPWYEREQAIVFVVGWTKEKREGYLNSLIEALETTYKRLWHRGYKGRFIVFRWDTRKYFMGMGLKQSEYRAFKCGAELKDFVDSLPGNYSTHVMGHSQGGVLLLEALKLGMKADSALFLQCVVPAEALDPDPALDYPGSEKVITPDGVDEFGYRGYLTESKTPVYNFFNQEDIAFLGWNTVQRGRKPVKNWTRWYRYYPDRDPGDRVYLGYYWFWERPVTDPHEAMAFVSRPRTYAIGSEPRVRGVVEESFDLNSANLNFGAEHGAQFSWDIQETVNFYNLLLNVFDLKSNAVAP